MPRLLLLALLLLSPAWATARAEQPRAMVAAANPLAAAAGVATLKAGGNAMDAAVAVQFVLGLVEPQASGLGGGAFLLHYDAASRAVTSWDGRETAPAAARADLFLDAGGEPLAFYKAVLSGRSVGVPGAIAMLQAAQRAHGKLRWDALAEPAIRLAREGFPVSPRLAEAIARDADRLRRQDAARTYFFTPDGTPLPVGTHLINPAYADALRAIADQGSAALHRGPIAADIVAAIPRRSQSGRHDRGRSRRLPAKAARAGVRPVSGAHDLRHGAAFLGRWRGAADPRRAFAFRLRRSRTGRRRRRASAGGGRAPRLLRIASSTSPIRISSASRNAA